LRFLPAQGRVGTRTTCEIAIVNSSTRPDENVELRLGLPPQLTPNLTETHAPINVRPSVAGAQLLFTPVAALPPGERVIYTIPMAVSGPAGFAPITADVRSRNVTGSEAQQQMSLEIIGQ
jgi:hypothetical protein